MLTRPGRTGEVTAARDSGLIHLFRHTTDWSTRSRNRMLSRPIRLICPATRRVSRPAGRSLSMSTPSPTWSRTRRGNLHRHPKTLQIKIPLLVKQVCVHKFVSGFILVMEIQFYRFYWCLGLLQHSVCQPVFRGPKQVTTLKNSEIFEVGHRKFWFREHKELRNTDLANLS